MNQIVTASALAMMALLLTACGGQATTVKTDEAAGPLKVAPTAADTPSTASTKEPCNTPKSDTAAEKKPCDSKAASAEKKPCDSTEEKAAEKSSGEAKAEAAKKPCCASKKTAAAPEAPKE